MTILTVEDRQFVAEWARGDRKGAGRLVDLRAVEERLTKSLQASSISWQLTDAAVSGSAERTLSGHPWSRGPRKPVYRGASKLEFRPKVPGPPWCYWQRGSFY